jgi:KUP system potassium uptake protein
MPGNIPLHNAPGPDKVAAMGSIEGRGRGFALALGAIGVVFGDIGTSPLYALRECFSPRHGISVDPENILGIVSLLVWTLSLIVCVKYLLIVLRADNKGEGGILALVSLVSRCIPKDGKRRAGFVAGLGILGAALLYSDGMITPAVSMLSAIEGLEVVTPRFTPFVLPLAIAILVCLFPLQSRGTARVGRLFGPIISAWFAVIGTLGLVSVLEHPGILGALNPVYAIRFLFREGALSFGVLGSVFLAMTGTEVMYADLGHFGRVPIRRAWFFLVYPALLLNYVGQGAFLLSHPDQIENLFFRIVPEWGLIPLVVLATMATIIASQAVISGAFSIARQSVQLGLWPRIQVRHTSDAKIGQVYVPFVNWFLMVGTVGLILGFKTSGNLANAYGIAVSVDMLLTSCLMIFLARRAYRASLWIVIPLSILFLAIDGAFFLSNASKLVSGGWIVVAFAAFIFLLMKTWTDGRGLFRKKIQAFRLSPEIFASSIALDPPARVPGTAVFLTVDPKGVPKALLHNLKHNRVLHERTIILSVQTRDEPYVDEAGRIDIVGYEGGIWHVLLHFGFSETPDVPKAIAGLAIPGFEPLESRITYFLGREAIAVDRERGRGRGEMMGWRKRLFTFMFNNAVSPADFFRLPPDRVVEIGAKTEL